MGNQRGAGMCENFCPVPLLKNLSLREKGVKTTGENRMLHQWFELLSGEFTRQRSAGHAGPETACFFILHEEIAMFVVLHGFGKRQ